MRLLHCEVFLLLLAFYFVCKGASLTAFTKRAPLFLHSPPLPSSQVSIRRMDDEALSQRKEYDQVINERDILGTQLIRRNDELALLYEKVRDEQDEMTQFNRFPIE